MERPQENRISVAIMGWILNTDTSTPLKPVNRMVTAQQARMARIRVAKVMSGKAFRVLTKMLPAMVPTAPTEISWPPQAAVTSVMPMAMMASSLALSMMDTMLPVSTLLPLLFTATPME